MILNVGHDRGRALAGHPGSLRMTFGPDAITYSADLPATDLADETLALIDSGALRGSSIEYVSERSESVNGVHVVTRGLLVGLALVGQPAYRQTSAVRRRWMYGL